MFDVFSDVLSADWKRVTDPIISPVDSAAPEFMSIRLKALPPETALEFFRQKGLKIGFDHREVRQAEHQAAFTVAKAMQMDLLRDIREQVDAAIELVLPFHEFRDTLMPDLVRRGWWGRSMMTDLKTGESKEVQL